MVSASVVKKKEQSLGKVMPRVEDLGSITKWMSDPPPKVPMKPSLQDKYHENRQNRGYHDDDDYYNQNYGYNLESLRLEDRVNTLGKLSLKTFF